MLKPYDSNQITTNQVNNLQQQQISKRNLPLMDNQSISSILDEKKSSPDGTRRLQDEINVLTKRNCELESQIKSFETTGKIDQLDAAESSDGKIRELEKFIRLLTQEKEECMKDKLDCLEKLKQQVSLFYFAMLQVMIIIYYVCFRIRS